MNKYFINYDHCILYIHRVTPWTPRFDVMCAILAMKTSTHYYYTTDLEQISTHLIKTRLLGRPQPQMYPPVALNQYTLVNRTHKHYIYICFKAPQTSLNHTKAQQYVKYGSNLMNIFSKSCFHFGGSWGNVR